MQWGIVWVYEQASHKVFVWHSKGKQLEVEKGSALLERAGGEEQFLAEVCTLEYLESHGTSWKKQSR